MYVCSIQLSVSVSESSSGEHVSAWLGPQHAEALQDGTMAKMFTEEDRDQISQRRAERKPKRREKRRQEKKGGGGGGRGL